MCATTGNGCASEAEKRIGHLYPKVESHRGDGHGAARLGTLQGAQADSDRLAVGADGEEPQPRLCRCRGAAGGHLHALHQGRQGSVRRAGDRGSRVPVHGEGREAAERGGDEYWDEAVPRSQLPVPDVGHANCGDYIKAKGTGQAHGRTADGGRGRGRARGGSISRRQSSRKRRRARRSRVEAGHRHALPRRFSAFGSTTA